MTKAFYCVVCGEMTELAADSVGGRVACGRCGAEHDLPEPGGTAEQEIYRHAPADEEEEWVVGDEECIERVSDHITRHLGPIQQVFHEVISTTVHIDVHLVEADNVQWLVTSGMSSRAMTMPDDLPDWAHAELCLALPPDWPVTREAFDQERYYWPVRLLREMARLPHRYQTWLGHGHSIPNGEPPQPYAPDTRFVGCLISFPELAPSEFFTLAEEGRPTIYFWAIYPVYLEEMNEKLVAGGDELMTKLIESGVTELIDVGRRNISTPR